MPTCPLITSFLPFLLPDLLLPPALPLPISSITSVINTGPLPSPLPWFSFCFTQSSPAFPNSLTSLFLALRILLIFDSWPWPSLALCLPDWFMSSTCVYKFKILDSLGLCNALKRSSISTSCKASLHDLCLLCDSTMFWSTSPLLLWFSLLVLCMTKLLTLFSIISKNFILIVLFYLFACVKNSNTWYLMWSHRWYRLAEFCRFALSMGLLLNISLLFNNLEKCWILCVVLYELMKELIN